MSWRVLILLLCLPFWGMAQTDSLRTGTDTVSIHLKKKGHYRRPARKVDLDPLLNLDNYNTLFFGQPLTVWGAKVGIDFMKTYRMGFGGYWLFDPVRIPSLIDTVADSPLRIDTTLRRFHLYYINTFMEFVLLYNYRWEVSMPMSIGYGVANVQHYDIRRRDWLTVDKRGELVSTFGLAFHYRIFSWFGTGLGLGYRQFWVRDPEVQQAMNGIFWSIKFKIFLGYMYKAIFKPQFIKDVKWEWREYKRERKMLRRIRMPRRR